MTPPSDQWFQVFPGPRIPDVLAYVHQTWDWLRNTYGTATAFDRDEPALTDSLCEALENDERRRANRMDCDFQAETWELRRDTNGMTVRVARADIRVILGAPGTPHLVIEFKKLDGTANGRWRYCFDGMNRFVEGKYAVGHAYGVMCGFCPSDPETEATAVADYIAQEDYARRLACVLNNSGHVITKPSMSDPATVHFDTTHNRQKSSSQIALLHTMLLCANVERTKKPIDPV